MTADLSVLLDQLKKDPLDALETLPPDAMVALAEVAQAAEEHLASWTADYGSYEEGQRIVTAREALEAALARLRRVLAGEEE